MGDHDYPATCLSSVEHGKDVRDVLLHYFGCLREDKRKEYYDSLPVHKQKRIENEKQRIKEQRAVFEVDKDLKFLVKRFTGSLGHYLRRPLTKEPLPNPPKPSKETAYGLNAYMVVFQNSVGFTDPTCVDTFPNQKIPVKDLLYNKNQEINPLMKPCGENEIRYFHLPGNNMEWIEVGKYFSLAWTC
jgi:hypothetical protein